VAIEISEEKGVRYLHFGSRWIQGAMRIARPYALELDYTREMMMPLALRPDPRWPHSALLIGLGAGSLLKFLHRHRPRAALTVIEIDANVVAAARQFFRLPHDPPRLSIEIANGDAWLAATRRAFDLILVDGFDARGSPGSLDSTAFYRRCRTRLAADGGMLVTNLLSRGHGVAPSVARLREAFDDRVLALPPSDSGNTVAVAAVGDPIRLSFAELGDRVERLRLATGVNLKRTAAALAHALRGRRGTLSL
jgi:spermidine synthase